MLFNKELEQQLAKLYPKGIRVECIEMPDDPYPVPSGTKGTVVGSNGFGQIYVHWDNGSTLNLIYGKDKFKIIAKE